MWKLRHWEVQWFAQSPIVALGFEPKPPGCMIPTQIPMHASLDAGTPVHTLLSLKASSIIWRSFHIRGWRAVLFFLAETLNEHINFTLFSLVQFSHSVMFDSLQPNGLQHVRPPCPSPTPRPCWNSCPLSQWCHPTISSSVVPFSSCLQSFPAAGSFPMRQFFASGGQSIGASASASVLPMNIQGWFPLGLTGLISLQSKGLSRVFSNTTVQKHKFSVLSFLYSPTLTFIHDYWKNHSLTIWTFVSKVMSLLFNMLSRLVIAFLPRSKHLLISWLQSPSAVILEPKKIKSVTVSIVAHLFATKWQDWMPWS